MTSVFRRIRTSAPHWQSLFVRQVKLVGTSDSHLPARSMHNTARTKPYKGIGMEGWIAKWYAKNTARDMVEYTSLADRLVKQIPSNACILEVAPGPGYLAIEIAKRGNFQMVGLDISRTFVDIATKNAQKEPVSVNFQHGNASEMPFKDGTFDFIVCRAAFKNFTEPVEALNEMHRVLKPGGRALILDLNKDASIPEIKTYVEQMKLGVLNTFLTMLVFRFTLIPSAYASQRFREMAGASRFKTAHITQSGISLEVELRKPLQTA